MAQQRVVVGQHGVDSTHGQCSLGANTLSRVGHFARRALRHDLRKALQHPQVGGNADMDLLHGEKCVGAARVNVACAGPVKPTADAAPCELAP